jgi:hypothetical protein
LPCGIIPQPVEVEPGLQPGDLSFEQYRGDFLARHGPIGGANPRWKADRNRITTLRLIIKLAAALVKQCVVGSKAG